MIDETGLPNAYYQFTRKTAQEPPFICFYFPDDDDFLADDENYVGIMELRIELYTNNKDFKLEKKVAKVLKAHELVYTKSETYIESERMYEVIFETEVILDA